MMAATPTGNNINEPINTIIEPIQQLAPPSMVSQNLHKSVILGWYNTVYLNKLTSTETFFQRSSFEEACRVKKMFQI